MHVKAGDHPPVLFLRSHLPCFFWHRLFHFLEPADAARLARSDPQVSARLHFSSPEISSSDDINSGDLNSHLHAGMVSSQLSLSPSEVSKSFLKIYLCGQQSVGYVHRCVSAHRIQKRACNPLEMELQAVVSHPTKVLVTNFSRLQQPKALLTTEPPLQPPTEMLKIDFCLRVSAQNSKPDFPPLQRQK